MNSRGAMRAAPIPQHVWFYSKVSEVWVLQVWTIWIRRIYLCRFMFGSMRLSWVGFGISINSILLLKNILCNFFFLLSNDPTPPHTSSFLYLFSLFAFSIPTHFAPKTYRKVSSTFWWLLIFFISPSVTKNYKKFLKSSDTILIYFLY